MEMITLLAKIQEMKSVYEQILETSDGEEIINLLDVVISIQTELTPVLSHYLSSSLESKQRLQSALSSAFQSAKDAQEYLEHEKVTAIDGLRQIKTGNKARQAYLPPAIGMGYTEGNFIDSRK